ncbi:MAG: hypothetical protein JO205_03025 [Pseudolabrys sp.]|nr:hypothetical protein [Pseudolabrys sp.]MBV9260324.1 hypothetical protein [Pseudolabrys sp.]
MKWFLVAALGALLVISIWFAVYAWTALDGEPLPASGYAALICGVLFSLLIGCGLMALAFYSHRHGYDDLNEGDRRNDR